MPPPDFLPQFGRNIDVPKPTIAAVNGVAYAGGFLLAQQCDLVVAAEHAAFAVTEVRVGRGAPWATPLPWLVGPRAAAEILLTGEPVSAARAYEIGLVNRVVPAAELHERTQELAERIAANAPLSVAAAKTHGVPVGARGGGRRDLGAGLPLGRRTRGAACLPGEAHTRLEGLLMAVSMSGLADDLAAESAVLRALLVPLDEAGWRQPTPAAGWSVLDQVTHLAWFDEAAVRSATTPEAFAGEQANPDPDGVAAAHRDRSGAQVLAWFDDARSRLLTVFRGLDPSLRVPWYGPPMSAASALTARIMETWAHGQDVADTLGVRREPTARLRHVAHIGIGARAYSYVVNGREVPTTPIRVELAAPDGGTWTWGPEDASDRVAGPALDFCLVVTQRRHLADARAAR